MDFLTILWLYLPLAFFLIALGLLALVVYLFVQENQYKRGHRAGYRAGTIAGQKNGLARGHAAGLKEGREAAFTENETFIQCPEPGCDKAIHVPMIVSVDGQHITAEPDTTELWLHLEGHKK